LKYALFYIVAIVAANYGFSVIPPWHVFGAVLPPMTFAVGAVFVLRDFVQRDLGHWVAVPIVIGTGLSFIMADPFIAAASGAAFAISESVDWLVYTKTKAPMKQRILLSSCLSVPADSAAFLLLAGFFSWPGFLVMVVSKMIAALIVWVSLK
jgi:queuosine precursor transporter